MSMPVTDVTALLLTDVVGSTALWQQHPAQMNAAMARHHDIVAKAVATHGGRLPQDQGEGDARFAAFDSALGAVAAAVDIQRALASEPWPDPVRLSVRMGLHAGEVVDRDGNLFGDPVNRCARIRGLAHGGQVLLSGTVKDLVETWLPEGTGLLDLGEHRMKDLTAPVRLYQVTHPDLPAEFPPLASLNRAKHNLPVQLSSFVGRERELAELVALVRDHPLVTISGFGGMGKTRVALQVGAELADGQGDGVWFVDLSAVRDAQLLPEAALQVLGVGGGDNPLGVLTAYLADKRILLICDNVEQLLPEVAQVVAALAAAGPEVHVLVTSREPMGLRGEQLYPMAPLPTPVMTGPPETAESLSVYDSAVLFIARATAADPHFAVDNSTAPALAAICARLDGWPLALELAAARVRLLGLPRLLDRLTDRLGALAGASRDAPDRQRTLRETIAWSFDLLHPHEQALLARLSVFSGGAGLDAIEAVCGPDLDADVLDALGSLLDKGLLQSDDTSAEPRFRLLESVRDFAAEQLRAGDDDHAVRVRHARYFRSLFPDQGAGPGVGEGFEQELPNVDAAIDTLCDEDPEEACRLHLTTSFNRIVAGGLAASEAMNSRLSRLEISEATRAGLAINHAFHGYLSGRRAEAQQALVEPTRTLLELGQDQHMASRGAGLLAGLFAESGDGPAAMHWAEQAIAASQWAANPQIAADALGIACYAARLTGQFEQAIDYARRALQVLPPTAGRVLRAYALGELCRCLVAAGDLDEALRVGQEAVTMGTSAGAIQNAFPRGAHSRALLTAGQGRDAARGFVESLQASRDAQIDPYDLGWAAVALLPFAPPVAAAVLGATDALFERTRDRDLYPPEDLLSPARERLTTQHPEGLAEGRRLGWPAVVTLLDDLDLG
jgi:predicted ATPase/class 3 adenylate cyclase/tetratricopeptide (TPR) repeat protein